MRAWDDGVRWHLEQVTGPDIDSADTLTLAFVRDDFLRCANGSAEDDMIASLIASSYRMAERATQRAHLQQTWDLVMDCFPACEIVFPKPPLQSVTSITYADESGADQQLLGSPLGTEFQIVTPSGPTAKRGYIKPLADETWPSTEVGNTAAVRIRFICGYPLVGSPALADVPQDIDQGRLLVIGEMYKQRSESVHAFNQAPALISARSLWSGYRAY